MYGIYDVKADFGAVGDGMADDTAAIQSCLDTAITQSPRGAEIIFPPGIYAVSSLNGTAKGRFHYRGIGGPGSVVLYGSKQTEAAPIFDFTKSSSVVIENIIAAGQDPIGNRPPVTPLAGFLLGQSAAGADSNKNRMDNCGSMGYFRSAPLCVIGSTDNSYYSCAWQQWETDRPCVILSTNPDYGITSLFQTITPGASNVGDQSFFGCEIHGHRGNSATAWPIYMRQPDNARFFGGNCDSSGPGHLVVQGPGNRSRKISFIGVKFYSESGHAADYLFKIQTNLNGLLMHCCNELDNAYSSGIFDPAGHSGQPTNFSKLG